jgi:hypothetical protein
MENRTARLKRIRILAVALVLLSLLILLVSAYIRLSGAGLGCSPWPDCYGQLLAGQASLHSGAARILHRSVASLALVLGFVLVAQCLRPYLIQPAARWATALLTLMILLTFVGLFSADPHRVWTGFHQHPGAVSDWCCCRGARRLPPAPIRHSRRPGRRQCSMPGPGCWC